MDIPRTGARKAKLVRRAVAGALLLPVIPAITVAVFRLKPAVPPVERATVWIDTVKRGEMLREVRGLGTLVPEETLLIPAPADGRIARILVRPGTPVQADTVLMVLHNPELETALLAAQYDVRVAEATYTDLRVQLAKQTLDLRSTAAQVSSEYHTAKMQAERDAALAKEGLFPELNARISHVKATELATRDEIERERLSINSEAVEAQLAAQKVKVEQCRAQYNLKLSQVQQLKVTAGTVGMLQQLPAPVEVGQKVTAGTPLGKVAQPSKLKAELKIAETQVKDITIGQHAQVDTRNGLIEGRVSRIDPSILNGTVTVDVKLGGPLPQAARPDLSVDGTIELERLRDVIYVGRPVTGQPDGTVQIFKLEADGTHASRAKVRFGRASVSTIEIREGLRVGDQVILSDSSPYDNYDRIRLN